MNCRLPCMRSAEPLTKRHRAVPMRTRWMLVRGDSLLGVKWRFFEHMPSRSEASSSDEEGPEPNFSASMYPQFALNSPSRLAMETESHGTQFLLPLEANACIGPIRVDAEVGYWFTNGKVPQSLLFGMIVGHEFTRKTEAYLELYDQQDS